MYIRHMHSNLSYRIYTDTKVLCIVAVLAELKTHECNWFHIGVQWIKPGEGNFHKNYVWWLRIQDLHDSASRTEGFKWVYARPSPHLLSDLGKIRYGDLYVILFSNIKFRVNLDG
jgi:hypothetical protein